MDARTSELLEKTERSLNRERLLKECQPLKVDVAERKIVQKTIRRPVRSTKKGRVRVGREVVKSGMAASMAVTILTGLKILRPMSLHPVASWIFLGLTLVHMVAYDKTGTAKQPSSKAL